MKRIIIDGSRELKGTIKISGAKNSAVALIPASILCDEEVDINNIPNISDIEALVEILDYLDAKIERKDNKMIIDASNINNKEIPEEISKKLRASYYFMSALLGKYKHVEMYFPGGCNIGKRPIDQTLKGFRALGATVIEENNKYKIDAEELIGAEINLDMPSVGATVNAIFASVRAKGVTTINNAAKEPEISNIAEFLNKMGAKIEGVGTSTITITGVDHLHKANVEVIPDRIEAGTYVIIGTLLGKDLKIDNVIPEHIKSLLDKLKEANAKIEVFDNYIITNKSSNLKAIDVITKGYPGFATDLQQPLTALLTNCKGISHLTETIYENRFNNVEYLNKMGANIEINERTINIKGKTKLHGEIVKATDLRAGACMVIAGLIADGKTTIEDIDHVLRGYENIIEKLSNVGAKITKEEI
ncbi:MAG: UDP-N-acetylglucosamine 1-carboxyvinyltransferase [Bacilli bacterium]|nr:UDP-N-acetylglucosamine 1-carboxyvinyltransferase [Bacilli bacterium]